jgi:phage terminase small subunit
MAGYSRKEDHQFGEDGLNDRQRMFVEYYLKDLSATNAAIAAGYSKATANKIATQLLDKPSISAAIQAGMDKRARKVNISAEQILENISRISKKAEDADDYGNALKGQEMLGKHLKLFGNEVSQDAMESLANRMIAAQERLRLCYSQQQKTIDVTVDATITKPEPEPEQSPQSEAF